jgi:hypothetical protein
VSEHLKAHRVGVSESGWTDNALTEQWFGEQFIPQAQARNTSGAPIALLLDGHNSHITDGMITKAYNNNIFLVCLPPKTTHRLQPLDVGVFGPVQEAWGKLCENMAADDKPVEKSSVIDHYMTVRKTTLTSKAINDSWRRTGHYPINPDIFTDEDYAPSNITSCLSHMPTGFPKEVPSSPESAKFTDDESNNESDPTYTSDSESELEVSMNTNSEMNSNKHVTRGW